MRFMINFFNLIRWQNLVLIILVQVLIKYALFDAFNVFTKLTLFNFILLVLATVFIAASGNIINDIYDVETDTINKPCGSIAKKLRLMVVFVRPNKEGPKR